MSTMLTTRHQTQIVVSPDSDDEEHSGKAYVVGPSPSNLSRTASSNSPATSSTVGSTPTPTGTPATTSTTNGSLSVGSENAGGNPLSHKYPHTRSALVGIIRDYRVDGDASEYGDEADGLLQQVVGLLRDENEDELKGLLKTSIDIGDDTAEQLILDLMHAHRDDLNQAPLTILNAAKRPISRPSSRASSHSFRLNRPESPLASYTGSAPSSPKPIQLGFRRPHTPMASPLVGLHANTTPSGSYMTVPSSSISPASSPPQPHAVVMNLAAASPSSSPLSSPRFLNAKEFRPGRPLSIGSNPGTPSAESPAGPASVWSTAVPPSSLTRTSSNLAIATPRSGTPINPNLPRDSLPTSRPGSSLARPGSSLAVPSKPPFDDEDDDEFSPFSKPKTIIYRARTDLSSSTNAPSSEGTGDSVSEPSAEGGEEGYGGFGYTEFVPQRFGNPEEMGDEEYGYTNQRYAPPRFGDRYGDQPRERERYREDKDKLEKDPNVPEGMTPLDVLVSVFGATMSPAELENILAVHGWNFEEAMAFLVDKNVNGPGAGPGTPGGPGNLSRANSGMDERGATFVGRQGMGPGPGNGRGMPFGPGGRDPRRVERPGRVCRYFLAGECLRADCRFSHDLDRALCRFWLRGVCAKGDQCEFMHRLPPNMDRATYPMDGRLNESGRHSPMPPQGPPPFVVNPNINGMDRRGVLDDRSRMYDEEPEEEDFPALGTPDERGMRSPSFDPSRSRFASAVKKVNQSTPAPIVITGSKFAVNAQSEDSNSLSPPSAAMPIPTPKPSPRINLRPPTNLPTITTGEAISKLYTTYRERPLQLQAARNACLARAADAWRRGDGAGAKRFSRDANELNGKMGIEGRESAGRLVRERSRVLREAVLAKGGSGRFVGGGLAVVLGVARDGGSGSGGKEADENKVEVAIDLHGLHANEGVDYLEELILALENERFLGLTYVIIGEEKHTGTQDPARGASKLRLAAAVKEWLYRWGYPWNEWNGIVCVDCLTHY